MEQFVTVVQTTSSKFDVEFVSALTKSRVKTKGILITCWERTPENEKYCFNLADQLNNNSIKMEQGNGNFFHGPGGIWGHARFKD